jgi:hypothetical protein
MRMNTLKMLSGALVASVVLAGCASMEERLAKKVGCEKDEAHVVRNLMVPGYTEYTVSCKKVDYSCKIAPFTEVCNPVDKK